MENQIERKEKCIICGVFMGSGKLEDSDISSLKELEKLCEASGGEVVCEVYQNIDEYNSRTVIGKGKVEEIKNAILETEADIVVFDCELSGSNIRNLEDELNARVIDRSGLILDIFALRATTKEGKCQVELAQLMYNLPRLTGLRKNLSRLGGGIGTRGPGESQMETDKRHIRQKITNLKIELKEIEQNRTTKRKSRMKSDLVNIALVGYTNAGKSTLLNALTGSEQFVKDMLFATLDPLSKKTLLEDGRETVITDTVGFVRKLPHHLIEAFKSTLEETVHADLLIHIVDISDPDYENHIATVNALLKELEVFDKPILLVCNKADKADIDSAILPKDSILVSVKQGYNMDKLRHTICEMTKTTEIEKTISVPYDKTYLISQMYDKLKVLEIAYENDAQKVKVYGKEEIISYYEGL